MRQLKLDKFKKGWLIGDFLPVILRTKKFEFAVKHYRKGDYDFPHLHKKATEITVVVGGKFLMNGKTLKRDDIAIINKGQSTDFLCLRAGSTAVIKTPSVRGDKFDTDKFISKK